MIQLGDSSFWLEPGPEGWTLIEVRGKKRQLAAVRLGVFTSPAQVLQQREVKLPNEARAFLRDMVDVGRAGDDVIATMRALLVSEAAQAPPPEMPDGPSTGEPEAGE